MANDTIRRREAAATSGHLGDEAAARRYSVDPDPEVRSTAYAALFRMKAMTKADVEAALGDPQALVRRRACRLAIEFTVNLVPLLTDDDFTVAEQAAWALGERAEAAGAAAVAALANMATGHSDNLCREAAVAALGAIGDERGLPAILLATKDKPAIRRRAVIALSPFQGPEVDAAFTRAKNDRDWQVRQAAEDFSD